MVKIGKRFRIQTGRRKGFTFFALEWIPDQLGGLMVASITIFNVSFVWLGTAA